MLALNAIDVKNNFQTFCTQLSGEKIVILSEKEYNELAKAKRNLDYIAKLDTSVKQTAHGFAATKTLEELKADENQGANAHFTFDKICFFEV